MLTDGTRNIPHLQGNNRAGTDNQRHPSSNLNPSMKHSKCNYQHLEVNLEAYWQPKQGHRAEVPHAPNNVPVSLLLGWSKIVDSVLYLSTLWRAIFQQNVRKFPDRAMLVRVYRPIDIKKIPNITLCLFKRTAVYFSTESFSIFQLDRKFWTPSTSLLWFIPLVFLLACSVNFSFKHILKASEIISECCSIIYMLFGMTAMCELSWVG